MRKSLLTNFGHLIRGAIKAPQFQHMDRVATALRSLDGMRTASAHVVIENAATILQHTKAMRRDATDIGEEWSLSADDKKITEDLIAASLILTIE